MSVTTAPSPWPAPPAARQDAGWRFGRQQAVPLAWLFDLRRNVSITPRQLMGCYALLCALSLLVAAGFWWHGVTIVSLFTGLELLAVGAALLVFARHAADHETITLEGRSLHIEQSLGSRVQHIRLDTEWLAVEPAARQGSLVQLSGREINGKSSSVRIGRFVRPELRAALAQEIRLALRRGPENEPPRT